MSAIKIFSLSLAILFGIEAFAQKKLIPRNDAQLIHSSKCMVHFKYFEKKYKLPSDLLHSISLQESGRKHKILNKTIPWPWAVNVEGKGHYFDSKIEAMEFVKQQQAFGKKSIDVGCMQINLHHHKDAFRNISEAFDPRANIEYGAIFLREKYEQHGSWKKAIANYHSADEERGANYRKSVLAIASNIDKHKFPHLISYNMMQPGRPLYIGNLKQASYYNKMQRYKTNMMIHVPKNAYRRVY